MIIKCFQNQSDSDCWENSKTETSKDNKGALRNKRVEAAAAGQ
jgi:hypothetical protein